MSCLGLEPKHLWPVYGSTLKLIQIVITVNKCLLEHPIVYTVKVNLRWHSGRHSRRQGRRRGAKARKLRWAKGCQSRGAKQGAPA